MQTAQEAKIWQRIKYLMILLSAITFTPLVIPAQVAGPEFLGMPRTLWAGMAITFVMIWLTWQAGKVYPGEEEMNREH